MAEPKKNTEPLHSNSGGSCEERAGKLAILMTTIHSLGTERGTGSRAPREVWRRLIFQAVGASKTHLAIKDLYNFFLVSEKPPWTCNDRGNRNGQSQDGRPAWRDRRLRTRRGVRTGTVAPRKIPAASEPSGNERFQQRVSSLDPSKCHALSKCFSETFFLWNVNNALSGNGINSLFITWSL